MSQVEIKNYGITFPSVTDEVINEMSDNYLPLKVNGVDDKKGLASVHSARMEVKTKRVAIEKRRKELKADILDFGRNVDTEAKRITALLQPIEEHLKTEETRVTEEKKRIKREAEENKKEIIRIRVATLSQYVAVVSVDDIEELSSMATQSFDALIENAKSKHEEKQKVIDEQKRIQDEKAEAERLQREEEQKRLQAQKEEIDRLREQRLQLQREQNRKEIEMHEREMAVRLEKQKIQAEKDRIETEKQLKAQQEKDRAEAEQQAKIREKEAVAKAKLEERLRIEREQEEIKKAEQIEKERIEHEEALKPDREKLLSIAKEINEIVFPELNDKKSRDILSTIGQKLEETVEFITWSVGNL